MSQFPTDPFDLTLLKDSVIKWINKVMVRFADGGAIKAGREYIYAEQIRDLTHEGAALLERLSIMGDWPEARNLQLAMQNVMNYCKVMMDAGNIILDYTSKRPAPVVC